MTPTKPKKKGSDPSKWKKNAIKIAKVKGVEHVTYSGKLIPQRQQASVFCRCNCYALLTEEERRSVIQTFSKLKDHELQNTYLRGCVEKKSAEKIQRRPRSENGATRNSYTYAVSVKKTTVKVCKAAFLGLHGIKASRLKKKVLTFSSDIADNRGKHDNHSHIADNVKNRIREHISMFLARESYYSLSKNQHEKYLYSSLTAAEMHRLFLKENPDLANDCKYSLYKNIFNYEYNISFGYPRTDVGGTCEKQQAAAKATNDDEVKQIATEHELLIRKADVFNMQLSEITESALAMKDDCDVAEIALDLTKKSTLAFNECLPDVALDLTKKSTTALNECRPRVPQASNVVAQLEYSWQCE